MSKVTDTGNDNRASFSRHLANVRHDLRTPVGHILGYSEMLEEDLEEEPWPALSDGLKRIHASGERLLELIDDLLGPAKTSLGALDLPLTDRQLRTQVDHVYDHCVAMQDLAREAERGELLPDLDKIASAAAAILEIMGQQLTPSDFVASETETGAKAGRSKVPATTPDKATPQPQASMTASGLGEGGEILIVDDDAANRDLLQRRLRRQGYRPTAVADGSAALEYVQTDRPDLILLDMVMPGLSGMDMLRTLKDDKVLQNIPVIMLSALDDMDQIVQCILLGAEDYLFKPFNPVLLKARISASLEKQRLRLQHAVRLTVFISSPSDVTPERRIVSSVITRLNEELAGQAYLVPILWEEEPLLASETAQIQIVPPNETDIYVGIFWARMGTRLPKDIRRSDGSRYDSGSEFEFEDAMAGYGERGLPDMLVYRKTAEPLVSLSNRPELMERLDQKERLESFMRTWFQSEDGESIAGVYHVFDNEDQFERQVTGHLRKLVAKRLSPS